MLTFANVKRIVIPEGNVIAIDDENNVRIWQAIRDVIVNGVSPLSLPSAVQAPLVYLKQKGVCEQNGTPTPSVPIDIKCNNGAIKYKDRELPVGFVRLLDINFDGNFHYITNEKLYGTDNISMIVDNTANVGQNLFGCYAGTSEGTENFSLYIYGGTSTAQCYFRYGETLYRPRLGNGRKSITFGESGTTGFLNNVSVTSETFESNSVAWIGMLPNSSSPHFTGTIEGNILVSNRLKYIPCKRLSDGTIGYYETHNQVFLEPQGTGTPATTGIDDSQMELVIVGTKEVISINNQTASAEDLLQVGNYKDEQDIISGQVIRRVGVKVLNGTENFIMYDSKYIKSDATDICLLVNDSLSSFSDAVLCTHLKSEYNSIWQVVGYPNTIVLNSLHQIHLNIDNTLTGVNYGTDDRQNALNKVKSYIAAQYSAGTPIIILYALATETTEQVTPQQLNTVAGNNTITVTAEVGNIPLEAKYKRT